MKTISIAVVFDRKKVSDNHTKKGLVQVRVTYDRKPYFFSTGIKLYKSQWNAKLCKVENAGLLTKQYNELIELYVSKVQAYDLKRQKANHEFDAETLKKIIIGGVSENFIEWVRQRIEEKRGVLKPETLRSHTSNMNIIEEYGKFKKFSDLTLENIIRFHEWMITEKKYASQTIFTKHKVLKVYATEAKSMGKITESPYEKFKAPRGRSKKKRIITEEEIEAIKNAKIPKSYEKTRDLMLMQYYTGLAYIDLANADWSEIEVVDGMEMFLGNRSKGEVEFFIPILPDTKAILEKYDYKLPMITNQQCNVRFKKVAEFAEIKNHKEITTHVLRKGAGTFLLNKGVRLEIVSKFLGHSNTSITQKIYAKFLPKTIAKEINESLGLIKKKKNNQRATKVQP